jgi:hypothetical protein
LSGTIRSGGGIGFRMRRYTPSGSSSRLVRFLLETTLRLCGPAREDDRDHGQRVPFRSIDRDRRHERERLSGFGVPA